MKYLFPSPFPSLLQQAIALLVLMVASVLPCYSQQVTSSSDDSQSNANSSSKDASAPQQSKHQSQPYIFPTPRERLNRYVKSVVGPVSLLQTGVSAGINQWRDHPEEWEQGASGYGKRFASSFGKSAIRQTVVYGLDVAMELDTGFKRSTRKGFGPRLKDALLENITSRNKSGKRVAAVPRFAAAYTSSVVAAEAWYPPSYDYKDGLRSGTRSILTGFGLNLVREFVIKW